MARTVLEEMTAVLLAVPGPNASPAEVARWYELKAHLLEHIAAETPADRAETQRQATIAHLRSRQLLNANADPDSGDARSAA